MSDAPLVRLADLVDGKLRCQQCGTRINHLSASIAYSYEAATTGCFVCHKSSRFRLDPSAFPDGKAHGTVAADVRSRPRRAPQKAPVTQPLAPQQEVSMASRAELDPDMRRTLDILVSARRERLATEARNRAVLPEQASVGRGRRTTPQAVPFTSSGPHAGRRSDAA